METYSFVNVEASLIGVMTSLVRVDASVQIPSPRPAEFVQITRVGGTAGMVADEPRVEFLIWGSTWVSAYDLAALVRQRVTSITALDNQPVYRVLELGFGRAPDPEDGSPRYRFTAEIKLRGSHAP